MFAMSNQPSSTSIYTTHTPRITQYQVPYEATPTHSLSYPSSFTTSSSPAVINSAAFLNSETPSPKLLPPEFLSEGGLDIPPRSNKNDLFGTLRNQNLPIKTAWTAIPSSEGFKILDDCKRNSAAMAAIPSSNASPHGDGGRRGFDDRSNAHAHAHVPSTSTSTSTSILQVPCYNRETLFDEEWQAHMKDVHGVFLLWPETWMRRIEVLDLEPFGGDIGACNEVIMDG